MARKKYRRIPTPTGVEVTIQGIAYRGYCNGCDWRGNVRGTMALAKSQTKTHRQKGC